VFLGTAAHERTLIPVERSDGVRFENLGQDNTLTKIAELRQLGNVIAVAT
jgi:hypothetical protein